MTLLGLGAVVLAGWLFGIWREDCHMRRLRAERQAFTDELARYERRGL